MRNTVALSLALLVSFAIGVGEPAKFVWLGIGARAKSIGGTGVAQTDNPYGAFFNPALLSFQTGTSVAMGTQFLSLGRKVYYASFSSKIKGDAGVGIVWMHNSVTGVEARDKDGIQTGSISNGNDEIFFAFGKPLYGPIHFGIGLQYCQSSIENISTYTAGLQCGLRSDFKLTKDSRDLTLTAGVSAQNFLMSYRWNSGGYYGQGHTSDETFPTFLRGGIAVSGKIGIPMFVALECWQNTPGEIKWGTGVDAKVLGLRTDSNPILNEISLRTGLSYNGFSLGAGIKGKLAINFGVDYGIVITQNDPQLQHIVDLTITY